MSFKELFISFLTIFALTILCQIFDFAMIFFDYRFTVGIIVGIMLYVPVKQFISKIRYLN